MTDKEIIQAFECCTKIEEGCGHEYCCKCPMSEEDVDECTASLFGKVLDLIKRQQAEIEDLKAEIEKRRKAWSEDIYDKIKVIHEQNEQLDDLRLEKYGIKVINKAVPTTKAVKRYIELKAYKEFAEEFEKRCIASGVYPAVIKNILKNLVKELTEGSK